MAFGLDYPGLMTSAAGPLPWRVANPRGSVIGSLPAPRSIVLQGRTVFISRVDVRPPKRHLYVWEVSNLAPSFTLDEHACFTSISSDVHTPWRNIGSTTCALLQFTLGSSGLEHLSTGHAHAL